MGNGNSSLKAGEYILFNAKRMIFMSFARGLLSIPVEINRQKVWILVLKKQN